MTHPPTPATPPPTPNPGTGPGRTFTAHDPANPGDPMPMPTPASPGKHDAPHWSDGYVARREQAFTNAFELLVLAELARADGDPLSAVDLTNRAAGEFEDLGMHGPVILGLVLDMCGKARLEARRRCRESEISVDGFYEWLDAEPEVAS